MTDEKRTFFTSDEVKPDGWLKRQLRIQADGLSGNLHKVWRDVRDSAWIGGDAESWERVPYWLDGFVPMAYLLEDEELIATARKYMDAILSFQREDGWICPCAEENILTYDTWAVQLISKTLLVYYRCSGDERVPDALYRVMRNYYDLLSSGKIKLFKWGKARWFEALFAVDFLYGRTREPWLLDLTRILREQGTDYTKLTERWKRPLNRWTFETHIVNMAMMLKAEALTCRVTGEEYRNTAEDLRRVLYDYNGTPVELFTGDECLSGLSAIQGTELCSVAELMFSYETLYAATGDTKWAERLEILAFNAFPATFSDDMWAHQYDQTSNQINAVRFPGRSLFRTNKTDANMFGLEPEYGCCTANLSQGWPKFILCAFAKLENGSGFVIENVIPVPAALNTDGVNIRVYTDYPFTNTVRYAVKTKRKFTLRTRIPSFAEELTVDGVPTKTKNGYLTFDFNEGDETVICVSFKTTPRFTDRPHGLKTVTCGSLVFSLPVKYEKRMLEYEKNGVERKFPYCDYEYIGVSPWNYGFSSDELEKVEYAVNEIPFSSENYPVGIKAKMKRIDWGLEDGFETVCAKVPQSLTPVSEEETVILAPYGCANLRMTEMPKVE